MQATVNGATDSDSAELDIIDTFTMAITPVDTVCTGRRAHCLYADRDQSLATPQTIDLDGAFSGDIAVDPSVLLPASGVATLPVTVTGYEAGSAPFTVSGVTQRQMRLTAP